MTPAQKKNIRLYTHRSYVYSPIKCKECSIEIKKGQKYYSSSSAYEWCVKCAKKLMARV